MKRGSQFLLLVLFGVPFGVQFMVHAAVVAAAQTSKADAQREYNAGRYPRAADILTIAIAKSPDDASLEFLLGQSYFQLHEFNQAISSFERSIQLDKDKSEYHDWLGKAYGRKAEQSILFGAMEWAKKTHKEFETAVQLDPQNLEAQRDLIQFEIYAPGILGGGDDRTQKHIDDLEKIDTLQGELARGEFFHARKRFPEADQVYLKVLDSHTDRIGVYFEVADYYRDRQDSEKMGQAVNDAQRINPDDARLKFYRGVADVMKGENLVEAESLLKSYLATVPENSDLPSHASALEWLGKLYESQRRFSEAAGEYRQSLNLDPHNKAVEAALKRLGKTNTKP